MFNHRFRRVFVSGDKGLVTDREIISYIFSTKRLSETAKNPETLLDAHLGNLERTKPVRIRKSATIKGAALSMKEANEDCLVCERGVITPWDLLMKPFASGQLKIAGKICR